MFFRSICLSLLLIFAREELFSQDMVNYESEIRPLMARKCFECHNTGNTKGGVNLDNYKERERVIEDGQFWLKVLDQIKTRAMPPKSEPQLSENDYHKLVDGINSICKVPSCKKARGMLSYDA